MRPDYLLFVVSLLFFPQVQVLDEHDRPRWELLSDKPAEWYRSEMGQAVIANILSWQTVRGDWPKNLNTTTRRFSGAKEDLQGTFDNGATTGELMFLARACAATQDRRCVEAFLKGLDCVLAAQYPNGGWPQTYPPGEGYPRHITFNDDTMVQLIRLTRAVAQSPECAFVDQPRRQAALAAFKKGIDCVLKCQIRVNGALTVWCAQHDEVDFRPRPARTYELVSLSGKESAEILMLLMSLEDPSPEVVRAIEAGAAWYESAKLTGIRQVWKNGDKVIVEDPNAPPLWARFYEIDTNRPFFCGRDGIKKYSMAEIEFERRDNYNWYGDWGARVAAEFARWKNRTGGESRANELHE